jgi:hypothetical protein
MGEFGPADEGPHAAPQRPRQALQFQPVDAEPPSVLEFALWPEHEAALVLFRSCSTQWRYGQSGPTGLDYAGVRSSPAFRRLPAASREAVFDDATAIERAWLAEHYRLAAERRSRQQPYPG